MSPRKGPWFLSLLPLLILGASLATAAHSAESESDSVYLSEARKKSILEKVESVLERSLGSNSKSLTLGLSEPEMHRDQEGFVLGFRSGKVILNALDVSGIKVYGSLDFEDLKLDYAALGVGRFKLIGSPRVQPNLRTSHAEFENFMASHGLKDTFLHFDKETKEVVLGGRRPTRILFARVNPLVTVRGRFTIEGKTIGFKVNSVEVEQASGLIAREIESRVRSLATKKVHLEDVLAGAEVKTIDFAEGEVRVTGGEGQVLFSHRLQDEAAAVGSSDLPPGSGA